MPPAIRIIPCLDVDQGQVVKGVKFQNLRTMGDPAEVAARYSAEGADEICVLDVSATRTARTTQLDTVRAVADTINVPLTVGGGVRTLHDIEQLLKAGADKVGINSSAVADPNLVAESARYFGSQCIVVAIDAKRRAQGWGVFTHGGSRPTDLSATDWARQCCDLGCGELLVTSMDADGTRDGYDNTLLATLSRTLPVPIIASGGVGTLAHLLAGVTDGGADALLAASIFHLQEHTIGEVKAHLVREGLRIRPHQ